MNRLQELEEKMKDLLRMHPDILGNIKDDITSSAEIKYLDAKYDHDFLKAGDDDAVLFHGTNHFCEVIKSGALKGNPLCLACDFDSAWVYQSSRNLNAAVFAIMKKGVDYDSLHFVATQVRTYNPVKVNGNSIRYIKFQCNKEEFNRLPDECRKLALSLGIPLISDSGDSIHG